MITPELSKTYDTINAPPYELKLKVDDIVMLTRNLDIENGLTNNTRLRVIAIKNHGIRSWT